VFVHPHRCYHCDLLKIGSEKLNCRTDPPSGRRS
jgi:hypothetical protein